MNLKTFKFASRGVAALLLASVSAFALVLTQSSASSEQPAVNAPNQPTTVNSKIGRLGAKTDAETPDSITLKAEKRGFPLINLRDGKKLGTEFAGAAAQLRGAGRPQTMLNADLNLDGASDLIVGYASSSGGHLLVYQGNPDSLSAKTPESFEGIKEGRFPAPFLSSAKSVELPLVPDFIGAGDFNRDGYKDIIAAARGANSLVLLAGNAKADFSLQTIELPGQVTALLTENIDPADGQPDVAVALSDSNGAWLFVFDNEHNVFAEQPRMYPLPAAATSLALGQLDDSAPMDILAAAGGKAVVIHGSYPEKNESPESQTAANARQVETLNAGLDVAAVRVGNFVWDRENQPEIALLSASGTIRILQRENIDRRQYTEKEFEAHLRAQEEKDQIELMRRSADPTNRAMAAQTNQKQQRQTAQKWTEADSFQLSSGLNLSAVSAASVFTSARMTTKGVENLIIADTESRKIKVLLPNNDELKALGESHHLSSSGALAAIELDSMATPAAVLPMRLSVMTRPGLVMVDEESGEVSYALAAPMATFNVDRTDDNAGATACTAAANDCSLRGAIIAANTAAGADIVSVPANANPYTLTITPSDDSPFDATVPASGDLDIEADLTIVGGGQATTIIQAGTAASNGIDRVIHVRSASSDILDLSISNVTIRHGKCDTGGSGNPGSARCNTGGAGLFIGPGQDTATYTVTDTTITTNWLVAGNSGASVFFLNGAGVYVGRGDMTLTNTTVSNNETGATGSLHGGDGGGLLFGFASSTNPNNVVMNNCTVTGNIARKIGSDTLGGMGGGFNHAYDDANINGGNFSNNSADLDGGAIFGKTPTILTNNLTVTGNSAKRDGGGIWSDPFSYNTTLMAPVPSTNTFTNITVRNNTADSDNTVNMPDAGEPRGAGGGIYHDRGTLNLTSVTLGGTGAGEPNTSYDGGGLGHRYRAVNSASNVSTITINGGSIVGNLANNNGGGIFHDATRTAGNNSTISVAPATIVTLTNNQAKNNGGGVFNGGTATATLNNTTLRSNQANSDNSGGGDGGALYQETAGSTTTFNGTLTIGGSGFANSAVNGGGIRNNAGTVNFPSGSNITHNTATGTGGGISNAGTLSSMTAPTITNNTATGNGGGVHNTGTLGTFLNATLNSNSGATGGGLFSSNGALTISGGTYNGNTASTGKGGGIEHSGTSTSSITNASVLNNTGSGIHITGTGSIDVKTSTITGNSGDGITKIGTGTGSHFDSNVIHSNNELGIDLSDNGVTPNDTNDADTGPNNLQNYPVLNYVRRGTGSAGIASVTLNSAPGKYRIQYYANTACDTVGGNGEGEVLLAATEEITVPAGGTLTYLSSVALPYGTREQITATATSNPNNDANYDDGSTSEFSACRKVNTLPTFTAVQTPSRQQGSPASNSQIATVTDPDQTLDTLVVTVNGGASATVNGVTVSNIAVDASGNVTADVVASCTATNASFTLRVTDSATEFNETTLNVTVTPNTPPTVGNYSNTTVNAGSSGTVITPDAAPTDNGTVATLTAAAPGFTGTFVGNAGTGTVTVNSAAPAGVYTVTVTATDNCGATTTKTFQLTVNAIPTITGATISRQQGSPSSNSQIATVNDAEDAENTLVVTVNGGASATVNGVTVSNIAVDASGNVTADVVASCTATNASFTLTVTDSVGASSNATLTVNVTPNTPPTVGTYSTTNLSSGGGTTVTPSAAPGDNGSIASASATASGAFTGTLSVNSATGVVTISNANPGGSFTVSVTFTDNCGATRTEQFTLNVTLSISGTVSYGIIQVNQTQKKVPDVLLSVTNAPTVTDTTDSMGFYQLDGLTAGGNYTVTPTKTTDANGITPFDATMILRHVAAGAVGPNALSPDQQIAADTNGDGNITPFDATLILRYVVAMGPTANTGQVGTWKFVPPSTNYNPLSSSQSGQNYTAYLIGEIDGSWAPSSPLASNVEAEKQETALVTNESSSSVPAEAPAFVRDRQEFISSSGKTKDSTATQVQVLLPVNSSAPNGSVVLIPVWLNNDSNNRISSFKFSVRFDPNVLQPEQTAIEATDSLIGNGFMVVSDTATAGRLGVAATGLNNAVTDSGALVYLRFRVVGTINDSASALTFETTAQEGGTFEDNLGNRVSSAAANGSFTPLNRMKSAKQ